MEIEEELRRTVRSLDADHSGERKPPSFEGGVSDCLCFLRFVSCKLLQRTIAGHAGSNACGDTSSAVRHSAQEPAEEISQNHARLRRNPRVLRPGRMSK